MVSATPFFKGFGPLLFGKAPLSALTEAFAKFRTPEVTKEEMRSEEEG
jgi:hypothetical protein